MKRFIPDKVALLFIPACLLLAAPAFGQSAECSTDDDCADGQLCQKSVSTGGCTGTVDPVEGAPTTPDAPDAPPADCTSEPQVAETGYCYTPPTPCESDDECDEYLSCAAAYDTGGCAVDSAGNTTCAEVDPTPAKYCSIASVACATDDDCPREFECSEVMTACPAILCLEGDEDCVDTCEPSGEKYCSPKRIDCADSADCPSAWSCVGNVVETCSGGGAVPSDGATTPGADPGAGDGSEPVAPEEETCTTEAAVGSCQPDAWNGDGVYTANDGILEVGGDDGSANPTSAPADPSGESESASSGGGCSVGASNQPVDFAWVLALLAALPLVRRRQPAA